MTDDLVCSCANCETRKIELTSSLRALVERVERVGGYSTSEDQQVLWRAKVALKAAR